jgi:hypothetical protein
MRVSGDGCVPLCGQEEGEILANYGPLCTDERSTFTIFLGSHFIISADIITESQHLACHIGIRILKFKIETSLAEFWARIQKIFPEFYNKAPQLEAMVFNRVSKRFS